MGFSAGTATVSTSVAISATIPAPGNAPGNTLRSRTATPTASASQALTYGTGTGKANVFCDGEFLIAAGSSLTLNLYDGGTTTSDLTDSFGNAAGLSLVKNVTFVFISGGDSGGVTIGGAASNAWAGFWGSTVTIYPGGPALAFGSPAGAAVSGAAKNLKLTNNGAVGATVAVFCVGANIVPGMAMGLFPMTTYA